MKNVLIVGSKKHGTKNDPAVIASTVKSSHTDAYLVYWEDIEFDIKTGKVTVFFNTKNLDELTIDLVIAVGWYKNGNNSIYRDVAYAFAKYLEHRDIRFWNTEMGTQRSVTKLSCMVELALQELPVPSTKFSLSQNHLKNQQLPFIAKAPAASRGNANYFVQDEAGRAEILKSNDRFLVQSFLPNDHDIRIICFGGQPVLALKRSRRDSSTHLNNISQGGSAQWMPLEELNSKILTMCEKICNSMNRELAGIDLIPDASSPLGYSCLEVNAIPQLTTGSDVDVKMEMLRKIIKEKI